MAIHLASLYAYLPYQHGYHVGGDVGMSVGGYEAEGGGAGAGGTDDGGKRVADAV
jgi:hypothetical protein